MIDHHFPAGHRLRTIINRNCIKMSYSCCKNVKSIILAHNNKILSKKHPQESAKPKADCNCRRKEECMVSNKCKTGPVVYRATVLTESGPYTYVGATQNFKGRYSNHSASFKNENLRNATSLSSFIWENNMSPDPPIKWEILRHTGIYKGGGGTCDLSLCEKLMISREIKSSRCLNQKAEMSNKCLHKLKYRLNRA